MIESRQLLTWMLCLVLAFAPVRGVMSMPEAGGPDCDMADMSMPGGHHDAGHQMPGMDDPAPRAEGSSCCDETGGGACGQTCSHCVFSGAAVIPVPDAAQAAVPASALVLSAADLLSSRNPPPLLRPPSNFRS